MKKEKPETKTATIQLLRELAVMNAIQELVREFYPEKTDEGDAELCRVFNWAQQYFVPEPESDASYWKTFMRENLDKLMKTNIPPCTFIPGIPGTPTAPPPRVRPPGQ